MTESRRDAESLEGSAQATRPRASAPLIVLSVIAVLTAMYVARDVLIPVVLAILLALLLRPLVRKMRGLHLPDALSSLVLIAGVAALFVATVLLLAGQAEGWLAQAPQTIERVRQLLPAGAGPLQKIEETTAAVEEIGRSDECRATRRSESKVAGPGVRAARRQRAYRRSGSDRLCACLLPASFQRFAPQAGDCGCSRRSATSATSCKCSSEVENGISRYLFTITAINIGLGVATGWRCGCSACPTPCCGACWRRSRIMCRTWGRSCAW